MQIQTEESKKERKKHGNYGFPVDISVEHIEAYEQGIFFWHWHPEIELTLVLSGEMEYCINDKCYHLRKGEGMFGNSNTLHSGRQIEHKKCTYLVITFHPRFIYGYENSELQVKYVKFITENQNWDSLKLTRDLEWQHSILSYMEQIYALSRGEACDFELQVHIMAAQIWKELYGYFHILPKEDSRISKKMQRLQIMISYLQEHYNEEVSLDEVAEQVNICKSECCRFFRHYMNMTIFDYLLYLRIQNSLPLLERGENITRTADLVGFSSAAYFGQIFRRYMKMTPREYQKSRRA